MNDTRTELIAAITELARLSPDLRVGQLVCNLANLADEAPVDLWDAEDEDLLPVANRLLRAMRTYHKSASQAA